jgi:hypothetical protein
MMDDHIGRVANALDVGAAVEDIHAALTQTGMSENDIYLTYMAGKLLHETRAAMPAKPSPKIRRIVSTQIG